MDHSLIGFLDLLQKTINQFKDFNNLKYYLKTILVVFFITLALLIPLIIVIGIVAVIATKMYSEGAPTQSDTMVVLFIAVLLLVFTPLLGYISGLNTAVVTRMALDITSNSIRPVRELLKFGYSKAWRLFAINLLFSFAVVFGLIILVIPGLILAILLQFSTWASIHDNMGVRDSLKASSRMVKVHFWSVVGYGLGYGIISIVVIAILTNIPVILGLKGLSEILSVILNILTNMFSLLFYTNLFLSLRDSSGIGAGMAGNIVSPDAGEEVGVENTQIGASGRAAYLTTHVPTNYNVAEESNSEEILPPSNLNTIPDPD